MAVITHVKLENNIHELVFSESSRRAIDQFLDILVGFYHDADANGIYVVLDMRQSGMLPLRYLTKNLRRVIEAYSGEQPAHIALVLNDPQLLNVARALLHTIMRRETVHYFTEVGKARLWLRIMQDNVAGAR